MEFKKNLLSDSNTFSMAALDTFLANKRKRPCEDVHEVRQPVWVGRTVELADVHHVVLILQHRRLDEHNGYMQPSLNEQYLIVVHVEIVGCREDGYETWEASGLAFAVHPVPAGWNLVTRVSRRFLADIFAQCTSHHDGI